MNKGDFIVELCEQCDLTKRQAKEIYECFIEIIKDKLYKGEEVSLQGLGKFLLVQTKARKAYSVSKNQMVKIGPVNKIKFVISTTFKQSIN